MDLDALNHLAIQHLGRGHSVIVAADILPGDTRYKDAWWLILPTKGELWLAWDIDTAAERIRSGWTIDDAINERRAGRRG